VAELPIKMKAAVFTGDEREFEIVELPMPVAGTGEALVRVRASGICGSDLHATANGLVASGTVMGHELAGDLVELGPDPIGSWQPGQRVFALPLSSCGRCERCTRGEAFACVHANGGLGGTRPGQAPGAFAEFVRVGTNDLLALPDDLGFDAAAMLEPLSVAMLAARKGSPRPDTRALVLGGGPIGLSISSVLSALGVESIALVEPAAHRREIAARFGATEMFDSLPADREFDVVYEAVGRPGLLNAAVGAVCIRGVVVSAGICREPDLFDQIAASAKEVTVHFPLYYGIEDARALLELVETGKLDPAAMISHRVGLDELPTAFAALRRPTVQVKVVVEP
jgi:(R,R)-butanediol dehydrogenase/meso-butanediol dehydrogenase/diacetyl reductase